MVPSCVSKEIHYARSTKLPEEAKGMMRLCQDSAVVNIVGEDVVAEKEGLDGYILLHESEVAQFVKNTIELQKLLQQTPTK